MKLGDFSIKTITFAPKNLFAMDYLREKNFFLRKSSKIK